jgi:hypothetical protein
MGNLGKNIRPPFSFSQVIPDRKSRSVFFLGGLLGLNFN